MRFTLLILSLLLTSQAPAGYVNSQGYTDHGLLHNVIVGGREVPKDRPVMRGLTVRLLGYVITQNDISSRGELLIPESELKGNKCTGTLIAPDIVLTAAHCIVEGQISEALVVELDGSAYAVETYARHPGFKPPEIGNLFGFRFNKSMAKDDIALLFLKTPVFGAKSALLPPEGVRLRKGTEVHIAGYGYLSENGPSSDVLRSAVTQAEEAGNIGIQTKGPTAICDGDSGGPLLYQEGSRYAVVGVASSSDCKTISYFTRVSDYISWINSEIAKYRSSRKI